jgi:hypothetical protein
MNQVDTKIEQVDLDLDAILNPSAEDIIVPENQIFQKPGVDTSFVNDPILPEEKTDSKEITETLAEIDPDEASVAVTKEEPIKQQTSSKKAEAKVIKKLVESGVLFPFEDEKDIEDYSEDELQELIEANFKEKEKQIKESTPKEFFESLPEEIQVAAEYVARGGKDLKSLFRVLSEVEETRELNLDVESDQEKIVREYLKATNFGDDNEIQEEIESWKDLNQLKSKASKFKPKLDALAEERVNQKLQKQAEDQKLREAHAKKYMQSVFEVIEPGELGGIKLDKKNQQFLYEGLTQPKYQSITGKQTNLLGHLLEKYQFVEPNHGLIAEALWLLSDPEGYKSKIKEVGVKTSTEKTVKMLKTEQSSKGQSSPIIEEEKFQRRSIPRTSNIFARK